MNNIPQKLRREIAADYYYRTCARVDNLCDGRITLEHAIIVAGKQLQKKWAIIPLCAFHHSVDQYQDGPGLNKEINRLIALSRASQEDFQELKGSTIKSFNQELKYLLQKYREFTSERLLKINY